MSEFVELASIGEAPRRFAFWSGVFALSAALGRKAYIPMGPFDWVPNYYIILVAPPGVAVKSTTINLARQLLAGAGACHFGPSSVTWQALADVLVEAQEQMGNASVALCVSELGTFLDLADAKLIDVLTDLWDGSRREWWHRTRGHQSKPITDPCVTMIAATTPSWIQAHLSPTVMEGGLASRCIFVVSHRKERLVAYPVAADDEWARRRDALTQRLDRISRLSGEFRLTEEAVAWGTSWYEAHWSREPPSVLASWWSRKQAHMHKLAMILSIAESESLIIEARHLAMAAELLNETESSLVEVFQMIETTEIGRLVSAIETAIRQHPRISYEDLFGSMRHRVSVQEFNDAITALHKAKRIAIEPNGASVYFVPLAPG